MTNLWEEYDWVPDDCTLEQWNAKTFCSTLGNRTVLIVGDRLLYVYICSTYMYVVCMKVCMYVIMEVRHTDMLYKQIRK